MHPFLSSLFATEIAIVLRVPYSLVAATREAREPDRGIKNAALQWESCCGFSLDARWLVVAAIRYRQARRC